MHFSDAIKRLRYAGDSLGGNSGQRVEATDQALLHHIQNALRIGPHVTPELNRQFDSVCERLHLDRSRADAFVIASPDLQAHCHLSSGGGCIVSFTSGLIELLSSDEFAFVCGHELGHFLFNHGVAASANLMQSVEGLQKQRAQEISADRIGLVACRSLETALRTIIKTTSGLSDRHLRFDVSAFLAQLKAAAHSTGLHSEQQTHPSMLVRGRALLWFSTVFKEDTDIETLNDASISEVDQQVAVDFERYVEGAARRLVQRAVDDLELWLIAAHVVRTGAFRKADREWIEVRVGPETTEKLRAFLGAHRAEELATIVDERIEAATNSLTRLAPLSAAQLIDDVRRTLAQIPAASGQVSKNPTVHTLR